jgi:hypothetical protein
MFWSAKTKENIAKDRKVIPDPIDDIKNKIINEWKYRYEEINKPLLDISF